MRIGASVPGGVTAWNALWSAVKDAAKGVTIAGTTYLPLGAVPVPTVRRTFEGGGLPATYAASACKDDPSLGVISLYSFTPNRPGTGLTGAAALQDGWAWIAGGGLRKPWAAWIDSIPDGQLVDFGALHEWNAKVNQGLCTQKQVNDGYVQMAADLASIRAERKTDGTLAHPKATSQVRLAACITAAGAANNAGGNAYTGIETMLAAIEVSTEDPYGHTSTGPTSLTDQFATRYVDPWLTTGANGATSQMRAGGIWEFSSNAANSSTTPWPGTSNSRPDWVTQLLNNALAHGFEYASGFHSGVNGSTPVFDQIEDKRNIAEWMVANADMSPPPTAWPSRDGTANKAPTVPGNLRATSVARPVLTWTASTDDVAVTGYSINRNSIQVGSVSGTVLTWTEPAALSPGAYRYTVRATDAQGAFSAFSTAATATVAGAVLPHLSRQPVVGILRSRGVAGVIPAIPLIPVPSSSSAPDAPTVQVISTPDAPTVTVVAA